MAHWLWVHLGLNSGNSSWYLWPSGWGSIILPPLITLSGLAIMYRWHHTCHVDGCYRYARRRTAAGDLACRKHHPERRLTAQALRERHHLYLGSKPGRG